MFVGIAACQAGLAAISKLKYKMFSSEFEDPLKGNG